MTKSRTNSIYFGLYYRILNRIDFSDISLIHKQQMIAHAQEFRLLADVEMIPQVLLIRSFIQAIDKILKQFTGSIGCNLVTNLDPGFVKKFSATIRGMERKGEII